MSEDIDRRIAIEVMGEEEPDWAWEKGAEFETQGWMWNPLTSAWIPRLFSTSLAGALRAVEKARETHSGALILLQNGETRAWDVGGLGAKNWVHSQDLEVAICNLLLALKEKA